MRVVWRKMRIHFNFGILFLFILFAVGCGQQAIENGSIISRIEDSNLDDVNRDIKLMPEKYFDSFLITDENSLVELEGKWEKKIYSWRFTTEQSTRLDDGLVQIELGFRPQKRFKLNFSLRQDEKDAVWVELFYNRIRFLRREDRKILAEYPVYFENRSNKISVLFYKNTYIFRFNDIEKGRFESVEVPREGILSGFMVNTPYNPSSGVFLKYASFDDESVIENSTYNRILRYSESRRKKEYLRSVRVGDVTMPSMLTPLPASVSIPVKITGNTDLRFSIANYPTASDDDISIDYIVEYQGDDGEPEVLFKETLPAMHIFNAEWVNCKVDMKKYDGQEGTLIFKNNISGGSDKESVNVIPLWGAPRLLKNAEAKKPRNFILITIENFGSESLELTGRRGSVAPSITNIMRSSAVIKEIYPASTWVPASLFSIFTGKYPLDTNYFSADEPPGLRKGDISRTLAMAFEANGYDTVSFTQGIHTFPFFGLYEGFNEYYSASKYIGKDSDIRNSGNLVRMARVWAERRQHKNIFMHLHFDSLARIPESKIFINTSSAVKFEANFWKVYGRELGRLDGNIGRFIRGLWKTGALKNSVVMIMGVNGLEVPTMNGKAEKTLGRDKYLKVPVIVNVNRKFPQSGEKDVLSSLVDVYATVLDFMDFSIPEVSASSSMRTVIEGGDIYKDKDVIITELFSPLNFYPAFALREKRLKLLYYNPQGAESKEIFYDLLRDPDERRQLASAPDSVMNLLEKALFDKLEMLDMDSYSPDKNKWAAHYLQLLEQSMRINGIIAD